MKRIVICYDGTWNALTNPATVTNVVRVGQAVAANSAKDGIPQVVYYNAGVGSGGPLDQFLGGVFGYGLRSNVKRGLAFLALNWKPGKDGAPNDEIYIFGFSRGAYSARALAGVIGAIQGIPKQERFDELEKIWSYYRTPRRERDPKVVEDLIYHDRVDYDAPAEPGRRHLITCLGVWDTVGSYGIPAGLGLGALARKVTSWTRGFHDNTLGKRTGVALQAMAIDERRRAFPPTAWVKKPGEDLNGRIVEQVWFAGSHSNIGGGYDRSGLADLALLWMMARVREHTGLDFDDAYIGSHFWPCAACSLYRSERGWLLSSVRPFKRLVLGPAQMMEIGRKGGKQKMEAVNEKVHWSVIERVGRVAIVDETRNRRYTPANLPADLLNKPRAEMEVDERVLPHTPGEDRLIELCRAGNPRFERCALFCKLDEEKQDGWLTRVIGQLTSAEYRRTHRLHNLRDIWDMKKKAPRP